MRRVTKGLWSFSKMVIPRKQRFVTPGRRHFKYTTSWSFQSASQICLVNPPRIRRLLWTCEAISEQFKNGLHSVQPGKLNVPLGQGRQPLGDINMPSEHAVALACFFTWYAMPFVWVPLLVKILKVAMGVRRNALITNNKAKETVVRHRTTLHKLFGLFRIFVREHIIIMSSIAWVQIYMKLVFNTSFLKKILRKPSNQKVSRLAFMFAQYVNY